MALRVIWQYMDRSITQKILYGPKLYGPVRHQKKKIIWTEAVCCGGFRGVRPPPPPPPPPRQKKIRKAYVIQR